jgi:hypothetical protein
MPQATIKLQSAPAPASAAQRPNVAQAPQAVKPGAADALPKAAPGGAETKVMPDPDEELAPSLHPAFLIAAAVLALAAMGIQIWTFVQLPPQ